MKESAPALIAETKHSKLETEPKAEIRMNLSHNPPAHAGYSRS